MPAANRPRAFVMPPGQSLRMTRASDALRVCGKQPEDHNRTQDTSNILNDSKCANGAVAGADPGWACCWLPWAMSRTTAPLCRSLGRVRGRRFHSHRPRSLQMSPDFSGSPFYAGGRFLMQQRHCFLLLEGLLQLAAKGAAISTMRRRLLTGWAAQTFRL